MKATDVAILDEALGGLATDLPLVVVGSPGSGRTVLSLQIVAAMLARAKTGVILSSEPPELLLRQADSLALPLRRSVQRGRLVLLELDARVSTRVRVHGGAALAEAIRAEAPEPGIVVFDSISALTQEILDEAVLRDMLRALFGLTVTAGGITVATVDSARLQEDRSLERILTDECGYMIRLERDAQGSRTLCVDKSRSGAPTAATVPFEISEGGLNRLHRTPGLRGGDGRARPKVLVAVADETDRARLGETIGERYDVVLAGNGFKAMSLVLSEEPDVLFLETELPRISGHEVMRSLQVSGSTIPILAVSCNMGRTLDRVRALFLGATDVQSTPLNTVELMHRLETLLALPGEPPMRPDAEDVEALLAESGRTRIMDEEQFSGRMARVQMFSHKHDIESSVLLLEAPDSESGAQALKLASEVMREEDSIFPLGGRRIIVLMVLTPEEAHEVFLKRLDAALLERGIDRAGFSWATRSVGTACEADQWKELFNGLQPWPNWSTS